MIRGFFCRDRWRDVVHLFQTSPHDPLTFTAVVIVLLATALLACCIPARRASHLDPIEALRD